MIENNQSIASHDYRLLVVRAAGGARGGVPLAFPNFDVGDSP